MKAPLQLIAYVQRFGKNYRSQLLPNDIERGRVGDCFDHCTIQAMRNRKYKYVEGIALEPGTKDSWMLHAWLTDGESAFDPTWLAIKGGEKMPVPTIYIGVEMEIDNVIEFMLSTRYKSVLSNAWRDPQAADRAAPGVPTDRDE